MRHETFAVLASGLALCGSTALAAYTDPSVLTIEGEMREITEQYPIDRLRVDFENVVVETRTPWTKERETIRFRGPRIADVLLKHGMTNSTSVQFIGYDNFTSEILLEEIETYQPIFAIDRACGATDRETGRCTAEQEFTPLSPEEQGPIFLVWPYEQLPTEYIPARNSIWVWFVVAVRPVE